MENIIVIKCGGSTLNELSESFFESIKELQKAGNKCVIVHGGGPEIKQMLAAVGVRSEFVNGLRKTTSEVMDVVEMVLAGKVNKGLVSKLQQQSVNALGLSGIDGDLLQAAPKDLEVLGYVGEVTKVNVELLHFLLEKNIVPVIAPIGSWVNGKRLNINADTAAGAVALQLQAKQLLFVTDVAGILKDGELLEELTVEEVQQLIEDGTIYGGMIPKVEAALQSMEGELKEVKIINGKYTVVKQCGEVIGTTIKNKVEVV